MCRVSVTPAANTLEEVKRIIEQDVFITSKQERIIDDGVEQQWIFDFRRVLLKPDVLNRVSDLFLSQCPTHAPFQVGGVEVASIPLITALALKGSSMGLTVNGFFMRKSRKKKGLLRMVEGTLTDDDVVLVDDLINSGNSLMRQVEIMEQLGKRVVKVITVMRFRDESFYTYFREKGIELFSFFSLDDFSGTLGLRNVIKKEQPVPMPFFIDWRFVSENPNHFWVVPKSGPVLDDTKVYFGADNGNLWAVHQSDGSVAWKYKVGFHIRGKYIFSTPAIHGQLLYFGAYDGNLYALDTGTGKPAWIFMEADWIGSSPCLAPDLGSVFIGLEFGLWKKRGGVAAVDMKTGKKRWDFIMPEYTHCSPAYSSQHKIVVCGCNDSSVYALDARTGKLLWQLKTGGEIKASFAIDDARGLVYFGSFDKNVYIVKIKTGEIVHSIPTMEGIFSTPLFVKNRLYVTSMDKRVYCIDIEKGSVLWSFTTSARIFSSPEHIDGSIYVGSNDGRLYELDMLTGKNTGVLQVTERIVNKVAYNPKTGKIFLPTFANELYCLHRESISKA